jgi:hypothetical protein
MPPTPEAVAKFRALMEVLTAKSKQELLDMLLDPKTPDLIAEIIRNHPALLGDPAMFATKPSGSEPDFVGTTEAIIKAHGFGHTYEWEYECEKETFRPKCLRIWIGKKRTAKNLRVLTLTEEEVVKVQPHLTRAL